MTLHFLTLTLALIVDRWIGDPDWLWKRIAHPVVLFGWLIERADRSLNGAQETTNTRRRNGVISIVALVGLSLLVGIFLSRFLGDFGCIGVAVEALVVAVFLAQKSLAEHVLAVATGLKDNGLAGGREAVSMIVGRDPASLDEAGVSRAAIESLAENFSDGVVAPAFWYAVLGLPGLLAYKMINTADSMIGHKNERYAAFGWASARLDDLVNWPAARLAAVLVALAAGVTSGWSAMKRSILCAFRDAGLHRSPNAGWPECAMAGALQLALAGNRTYGETLVREQRLNASGRYEANLDDIERAVKVYWTACSAGLVLLLGLLIIS